MNGSRGLRLGDVGSSKGSCKGQCGSSQSGSWRSGGARTANSSFRTHNTGFSSGTKGFEDPNFSKHANQRRLEREIDEYMIRHVVVRGKKTQIDMDGKQRWKFEKDGVVVISSSPDPDQVIITTFVEGFISGASREHALERIAQLMEELDEALDEEGRVAVLKEHLGSELSRVAFGEDLVRFPESCPLLQHCAKSGYVDCVEELRRSGNFAEGFGLPCKQDMNILHYIAWEGHEEIFDALNHSVIEKLVDMRNKFGELPEEAAWNRYLQLKCNEHLRRNNSKSLACFINLALKCAHSRLKDSTIDEEWFIQKANKRLQQDCDPASRVVKVPGGCTTALVSDHFERQKELGKHWRSETLRIVGVDLGRRELLRAILESQVDNKHLEILELNGCGIDSAGVEEVRDFISKHEGKLKQLLLPNNPIGDEGLAFLLGPRSCVLDTVIKLGLSCTGVTSAGLSQFGGCRSYFATSTSIRKIDLDSNELTEVTSACKQFEVFCKALSYMQITELCLRNTRLSESQLYLLLETLRVHPSLFRVSIQNVRIPDGHRLNFGKENLLLDVISDRRCNVKYLEVSQTTCGALSKKLNEAVRRRERSHSALAAIPERPPVLATPTSTPNGANSVLIKFRGFSYRQVEMFGLPMIVRLRARAHRLLTHEYSRVVFETEFGLIDKVECAQNVCFGAEDVGQVFRVSLRFVAERMRNAIEVTSAERMDSAMAPQVSTFRGLIIVLYRPATKQILMLRENDVSDAAAVLRNRLKDGVLSDHLATEERFKGASKKRQKHRSNVEELMLEVNMADFFDDEVHAISNFATPEGYTAFVCSRSQAPVSEDDPGFVRSREIGICQELSSLFQTEAKKREKCAPKVADHYGFFERHCSGDRFIGTADEYMFFMDHDGLFQRYWNEMFTGAVATSYQQSPCSDIHEFVEEGRRVAIGIVEVPEALLGDTNSPNGNIRIPMGMRTDPHRCKWVHVSAIPENDSVTKSLRDNVRRLLNLGIGTKMVATSAAALDATSHEPSRGHTFEELHRSVVSTADQDRLGFAATFKDEESSAQVVIRDSSSAPAGPQDAGSADVKNSDELVQRSLAEDTSGVIWLKFSRPSIAMRQKLLEADELAQCRAALESQGFPVELENGAKVFVRPEHYNPVLTAIRLYGFVLHKNHVVSDLDLEEVIMRLVGELRGREFTYPKQRNMVPLGLADSVVESGGDLRIERTFIQVRVPNSMRSDSDIGAARTVSTTDADIRKRGSCRPAIRKGRTKA